MVKILFILRKGHTEKVFRSKARTESKMDPQQTKLVMKARFPTCVENMEGLFKIS